MDGIRLNDLESLEAFGVNKQKLVEEITRAYAHQIYVDGYFNGDPHPGTLSLTLIASPPHHHHPPPPPKTLFSAEFCVGLYQIIHFVGMCCNKNLS